MLRVALIDLLLFALPFLLYAAYLIWIKGAAPQSLWQDTPFLWLFAAGVGLLIVVMLTLVQFSSGDREGTYHPPVLEDGVIKPGSID
jgi:Trk-type K+ transport system membrane component